MGAGRHCRRHNIEYMLLYSRLMSILAKLLTESEAYDPEYGGGLCNHLPLALTALDQMGATPAPAQRLSPHPCLVAGEAAGARGRTEWSLAVPQGGSCGLCRSAGRFPAAHRERRLGAGAARDAARARAWHYGGGVPRADPHRDGRDQPARRRDRGRPCLLGGALAAPRRRARRAGAERAVGRSVAAAGARCATTSASRSIPRARRA